MDYERILSLDDAGAAKQQAAAAVQASLARINQLEAAMKEFDAQAQAAPDGSAARDHLDDQYQRAARQLERARADHPPLLAQVDQAERRVMEAQYLVNMRQRLEAARNLDVVEDQLRQYEAQRAALDDLIAAHKAGALAAAEHDINTTNRYAVRIQDIVLQRWGDATLASRAQYQLSVEEALSAV